MNDQLEELRNEVREEARLALEQAQGIWRKPLSERVSDGRTLGPLTIIERTSNQLVFDQPSEDFAVFRELDQVRISRDTPEKDYFSGTFIGLGDHGLVVQLKNAQDIAFIESSGWTIDQDYLDLSSFYLRAIENLGSSEHGRDTVFPVLFGDADTTIDADSYADALDDLEYSGLNDSQQDAVATSLASAPFHLVQGPPGTGKTFALVRLVQELVNKGHRVLVTAFTHRAIHNALRKINDVIGEQCPVVKISQPMPEHLPFEVYGSLVESKLVDHDGAYVIGATPFALWSKRLTDAWFDSVVIDETSQMTTPLALMAMLKADNWFFFGDDMQLPPVSLYHAGDPGAASVFNRLRQQSKPSVLDITYRMNDPLTEWPSESFYNGKLRSHVGAHRLALKQSPSALAEILDPSHPLVRVELLHRNSRSRSDSEAELTAILVEQLVGSGLDPTEIGVVVPFRAQGARIRHLLRGLRFLSHHGAVARGVTVDTVDRFQGQEREVIIFSLTTSDRDFLERLETFLFSPQRINVAVTRARTKVIILHSAMLSKFAQSCASFSEPSFVIDSLFKAARSIHE